MEYENPDDQFPDYRSQEEEAAQESKQPVSSLTDDKALDERTRWEETNSWGDINR